MVGQVKNILSKDIEEIYSTSLSLDLLKIYSSLYLAGGQPRSCKASQIQYYNRLMKDGILKAKEMEEINKKTHKVIKKGLKYIGGKFCKHFDLQMLTDKEANELLQSGWMKETEFEKLPDLYKEEKKVLKEIEKEEKKTPKKSK